MRRMQFLPLPLCKQNESLNIYAIIPVAHRNCCVKLDSPDLVIGSTFLIGIHKGSRVGNSVWPAHTLKKTLTTKMQ